MIASFLSPEALSAGLAYIDGGVGSMIFQAAVGGILTASYFVTTRWTLLKAKVAQMTRRDQPHRGS
ncbi:MAG: hypothetical protein ACK4XJ_04605 [Fimbriimonadaceae bacterium]